MRFRAFLLFCAVALTAAGPASAADRGAYLARVGDCVSCHTAPGGEPFAGGLRMGLPFGAIFTTNITPDKATGIGDYSFADFDRALRQGIARDGHHLYPAMPYPSYAKITDADMHGLYDYMMHNVTPVHRPNKRNDLIWPLDVRWPLAIWNDLFLDETRFAPRGDRDAAWNRGAYLVETLGHCGACHTPRGAAWNEVATDERDPRFLTGEMLDHWSAPDLRGDIRTGLGTWSADAIVAFLKTGHNGHSIAFGAMTYVTGNSTPYFTDTDLAAIAAYLKALPPRDPDQRRYVYDDATRRDLMAHPAATPAGQLYLGQCAPCHGADGKGGEGVPPLAGNPTVLGPDPTSATRIVLEGGGAASPSMWPGDKMPSFRAMLSDDQIASIMSFVRAGWGNAASPVGPAAVAALRAADPTPDQIAHGAALFQSHGCGSCHAIASVPGAAGLVGPPLDTIGSRSVIAGVLGNTPSNLADWLQAPQRIKPGDAMPDTGLARQDALDLAAFLGTLR